MPRADASFVAPCERGHPDARWDAVLVDQPGGSWGMLADQVPTYVVDCQGCCGDAADRAAGED